MTPFLELTVGTGSCEPERLTTSTTQAAAPIDLDPAAWIHRPEYQDDPLARHLRATGAFAPGWPRRAMRRLYPHLSEAELDTVMEEIGLRA